MDRTPKSTTTREVDAGVSGSVSVLPTPNPSLAPAACIEAGAALGDQSRQLGRLSPSNGYIRFFERDRLRLRYIDSMTKNTIIATMRCHLSFRWRCRNL